MAGLTNKGAMRIWEIVFNGATVPTNFYLALVTAASAPGPTTNTLGDLTEIYSTLGAYSAGGISLTPGATDFPNLSENDVVDVGDIEIKTAVFDAVGSAIPALGDDARYVVLTDDNGTVASREVWAWFDLRVDRNVPGGQQMDLSGLTMRLAN